MRLLFKITALKLRICWELQTYAEFCVSVILPIATKVLSLKYGRNAALRERLLSSDTVFVALGENELLQAGTNNMARLTYMRPCQLPGANTKYGAFGRSFRTPRLAVAELITLEEQYATVRTDQANHKYDTRLFAYGDQFSANGYQISDERVLYNPTNTRSEVQNRGKCTT